MRVLPGGKHRPLAVLALSDLGWFALYEWQRCAIPWDAPAIRHAFYATGPTATATAAARSRALTGLMRKALAPLSSARLWSSGMG